LADKWDLCNEYLPNFITGIYSANIHWINPTYPPHIVRRYLWFLPVFVDYLWS
jgi:hypothetical protein